MYLLQQFCVISWYQNINMPTLSNSLRHGSFGVMLTCPYDTWMFRNSSLTLTRQRMQYDSHMDSTVGLLSTEEGILNPWPHERHLWCILWHNMQDYSHPIHSNLERMDHETTKRIVRYQMSTAWRTRFCLISVGTFHNAKGQGLVSVSHRTSDILFSRG